MTFATTSSNPIAQRPKTYHHKNEDSRCARILMLVFAKFFFFVLGWILG